MARRLPDFVTAFEQFGASYNSTPLFVKWSALWMIGTAVTRQVALKTGGNQLSPNMYIELVGGPGTGKGQAVSAVRAVFMKATKMSLIPGSVTRAGMEDFMKNNLEQRRSPDGTLLMSHECIGLSEEMQGILPDQDLGHLTLYNILYDLPPMHKAVTRSHGEVKLEAPYCSILTGAQPAFLAMSMPEGAWGMGFMSRSILVFDTPRERRSIFDVNREIDHKLLADLIHDLKEIHALNGWMSWTKDAIGLYEEWWVKHGGLPIPTAKRLAMGYNSRREIHMVKLAMICSLSRSNDLIVSLQDVAKAIELLLTAEDRMKHIFAEMSNTGAMVAYEEAIDMVRTATASGGSLDESLIVEFLMQRFPSTQVHAAIENLINSNAIESIPGPMAGVRGCRKFKLGAKGGSVL